ncbi:MAG TPA: acyl carrier protein [Gemmatimonadaceae bacterium]|nr:acyl carrier protein [Gemmatimonadaceae bacterium]
MTTRTRDELRAALFRALRGVAPEVEPATIDPARPLREQVDIDSIDFLNVLVALQRDVGVDVPEGDYAQVTTVDEFVRYLERRLAG